MGDDLRVFGAVPLDHEDLTVLDVDNVSFSASTRSDRLCSHNKNNTNDYKFGMGQY